MSKLLSSTYFLSLLSGLLLAAAWPSGGFALLLLVAWIPLMVVEEKSYLAFTKGKRLNIWLPAYLGFLVFNLLTTWWVRYASFFGAVAAVVCNALFMSLVFLMFHKIRTKSKGALGHGALIICWIAFEYLHMNWDLTWPWLTLGNGFAAFPWLVQWYEYTGVLGGTLWVFAVNILLFRTFAYLFNNGERIYAGYHKWLAVITIVVPVGFSVLKYNAVDDKGKQIRVGVLQPNVDPYSEKFSGLSTREQTFRLLKQAGEVYDDSMLFVVAPETAIPMGVWEEDLETDPEIQMLQQFSAAHHKVTWVTGISTYKLYKDSVQRSATARKFRDADMYYDAFNTAVMLDDSNKMQIHHKSKLVPGVEKMPFPGFFGYFENFAIDLGGITGSLGVQEHPSVFTSKEGIKIAPVICYESVYGDYVAEQIRGGTTLIFIITNDGWWKNTPGHRQHLAYASLRAIEFRRSIARSANTGISCFINQRGDVLQPTGYWEQKIIKADLYANDELTFYARYGDYIGRTAVALVCLVLLFLAVNKVRERLTL